MLNVRCNWKLLGIRRVVLGTMFLVGLAMRQASPDARGVAVTFADGSGEWVDFYRNGSYAMVIGVGDYTHGWAKLETVPSEIQSVEQMLLTQGFILYQGGVLLNPTSDELKRHFEGFFNAYGYKRDVRLLIFFSGHGYTRDQGRRGYLVPKDAPLPAKDEEGFLRKALSMDDIHAWARKIEAPHALFLFDSCFSGTIFKTRGPPEPPCYIQKSVSRPVRQFLTSGSANEEVPARSVFTPAFVDGISSRKADRNGDGYVTGTELGQYLFETVTDSSPAQTPQFGKINDYELAQGDFVFAVGAPSAGAAPSCEAAGLPALPITLEVSGTVPAGSLRSRFVESAMTEMDAYIPLILRVAACAASFALGLVGLRELFGRLEVSAKPQLHAMIRMWVIGLDRGGKRIAGIKVFASLFDAVYSKPWMLKFFLRSVVSSVLAVLVVSVVSVYTGVVDFPNIKREIAFLLIGVDPSLNWFRYVPGLSQEWRLSLAFLLLILAANAVPDSLSLMETRWLINLSPTSLWAVPLVLAADLILTCFIFLLCFGLAIEVGTYGTLTVGSVPALAETAATETMRFLNAPTSFLTYQTPANRFVTQVEVISFLATFFTSAWLWLHLASGVVLKVAGASARPLMGLFDVEERPIAAVGSAMMVLWGIGHLIALPIILIGGR